MACEEAQGAQGDIAQQKELHQSLPSVTPFTLMAMSSS